jgi:hypothetical protein
MDRMWNQYARQRETANIPSPALPRCCPNCGAEISWGWTEEDEPDAAIDETGCIVVHIRRIPRPDQTVFCPNCEAQILN